MKINISIIIPVYNEENILKDNLFYLRSIITSDVEVIVVDGGSMDHSRDIAAKIAKVRLLVSDLPSRSLQMNLGAKSAKGDILLFLHADARLSPDWRQAVEKIKHADYVGGAFRITCGTREKLNFWHRIFAQITTWRSISSRIPYGDQAIFVRRSIFQPLGGFDEMPIMEDYAFSKKLIKAGKIYYSPLKVDVSYRRFKANLLLAALLMCLLPRLYDLGVHPEKLAKFYKNLR
ncbi:TIGR04283 family arsenosugar biosynthesis glycosyltransferase [bacterium]|nr:TIGR04283 family arsenosugar biosynthesis glycosyltransferase [bacterium]